MRSSTEVDSKYFFNWLQSCSWDFKVSYSTLAKADSTSNRTNLNICKSSFFKFIYRRTFLISFRFCNLIIGLSINDLTWRLLFFLESNVQEQLSIINDNFNWLEKNRMKNKCAVCSIFLRFLYKCWQRNSLLFTTLISSILFKHRSDQFFFKYLGYGRTSSFDNLTVWLDPCLVFVLRRYHQSKKTNRISIHLSIPQDVFPFYPDIV